MLVLAPTRELACQIEEECVKFGETCDIRSTVVYGGVFTNKQIKKIQAGVEVLIATPDRLSVLVELPVLNLSQIMFLVLDKADRMFDMGFEPQIQTIISAIPPERQTLFFTATWPLKVQQLALPFLRNPVVIKFGRTNSLSANKQTMQIVNEADKSSTLTAVLAEMINPSGEVQKVPKAIIFVSTKFTCGNLANKLSTAGYSVDSLHGDRKQDVRTQAINQFKNGKLQILVATDIAALADVKDIEFVINYDFPAGNRAVENYVHRIGMTATDGKAYTFFTDEDVKRISGLLASLRRAEQEVPEDLDNFVSGRFGGGIGGREGSDSSGHTEKTLLSMPSLDLSIAANFSASADIDPSSPSRLNALADETVVVQNIESNEDQGSEDREEKILKKDAKKSKKTDDKKVRNINTSTPVILIRPILG